MKSSERLSYIDNIRGIAASLVLIQHAVELAFPLSREWLNTYLNLGVCGVAAFFWVSGYVILKTLDENPNQRRFWVNRFFRLYPVYWVSIAYALLILLCMHETVSWTVVVKNLTMLQQYIGAPNIIEVYWTLGLELFLYLMISIYAFTFRGFSRLWWMISVTAIIGAVCFWLLSSRRGASFTSGHLGLIGIAALGGIYRLWEIGKLSKIRFVSATGCLVLAVGIYISICFWLFPSSTRATNWGPYCFMISYATAGASILFLLAFRGTQIWSRTLSPIGKISYSLYLFHLPFLLLLNDHKAGIVPMILGSVAIGACGYFLFEKPFASLSAAWRKKLIGAS